ncbi:hypothetical protein PDESU_04514 [Pontiella desulfatans]|uniref:Outer membrane protein beta-barrel domain-containing protein n=1 Tax=Pontiella desulfatans TaxID=2750659 RepID=A0A6C2U7L8_PONDE|nr:autotransporter outer membrane beta-barrel domain-containing protein [Pontiella desulfatans]VGO15925.1 hypothetical protein PDESU_04514 [Pontiella desulfatans]
MHLKLFCLLLVSGTAFAATNGPPAITFPRWAPSVRAGSVYHFDADIEGDGPFSVNRYYIEAGLSRMWDFSRMLSFSVGYGQEDYNFNDLAEEPWNNIDSYSVGLFARWALNEEWMLFAAPSVRSYVETGADVADGLGASFFGGVGYRFGESLFLGPAFGVFGRIEDDPLVIPILLVNWDITERLNFSTGGGFAATAGPGLGFTYELSKHWKLGLLGRYESFRFRLSPGNSQPDGLGEDKSFSLVGSVMYEFFPGTYVSGIFGSKMGGEMSVSDADDHEIASFDYGSGLVGGLVLGFRM